MASLSVYLEEFRISLHQSRLAMNCKSNKVYNEIRQAHYKKVLTDSIST